MIKYNSPIVVVRQTASEEQRLEVMPVVDTDMIVLPVDADIEEGHYFEQKLPNGKTRTMFVTKVDVLQSPFGTSTLDHTEAHFTTPNADAQRGRELQASSTFNVTATNVQVATGDQSHQTMTVLACNKLDINEGTDVRLVAGVADAAVGERCDGSAIGLFRCAECRIAQA